MSPDPRDIHSLEQVVMREGAIGVEVDTLSHHVIDDVYTKVFLAKKSGTFIGQHAHAYDHGHLVAAGSFRLFANGAEAGDFGPGEMMLIRKGMKHVLMSLEDNSVGACIHNTHGEDEPAVVEENVFQA